MDPPGTICEIKRKKKSNMTPAPFNEGIKRTMSAKTPSTGASLTSNENNGVNYNQGRWTSLEHYKFLEALKRYGKEWQKVQQHVSTRTSTQARSHAQKFFVKLDKKSLTLEEFLKDLDLEDVKRNLLSAGVDNTDYDEEREVNMIANKKMRGSVMNLALPNDLENNKNIDYWGVDTMKRAKSEAEVTKRSTDASGKSSQRASALDYDNYRWTKRIKTSEYDERDIEGRKEYENWDEKPCSEEFANVIAKSKNNQDGYEHQFRKLSFSNFEPIQPAYIEPSNPINVDNTFGTAPQVNNHIDDYHINIAQLFGQSKAAGSHVEENDPQSGNAPKKCQPSLRVENRWSFDFYELNAEQLMESTPVSYRAYYKMNQKDSS